MADKKKPSKSVAKQSGGVQPAHKAMAQGTEATAAQRKVAGG